MLQLTELIALQEPITLEHIQLLIAMIIIATLALIVLLTIVLKGFKASRSIKRNRIRKALPADRTLFGINEPNKVVRDMLASCEDDGKQPVSIVIEVHYV